jgi:hypothetical protein
MKRIIALAITTLAFAAPASAQDARWSPWVGCWDPAASTQGAHVCVERAGDNAVTLRTTVAGQRVLEQTIVADGVDHPVSDAECRGMQRAEWSADGQRLFAHAELKCTNEQPRTVSGLALLTPDGTWLDIQAVRADGRDSTRVRRYRRVAEEGATFARPAGTPLTIAAISEASRKVSPAALEAAVVETHTTLDLSSRRVIELADAGVPERLIDVMIALSYPKKFVVERTSPTSGLLAPPLYLDSDPFYYASYYYSPFAYGYGGYYYPYAFSPAYVTVGSGGSGSTSPQASGAGRVIDGVGYTRVTTRQPTPAQTGNASSGGNTTTGSTSSSSGSGGTVSTQGYSGGSSGGDGGRTAVPR